VARIFITYRSEDPGWSVALDRELSIVFGPEQVFRASRTMQLGESFPERIRAGIAGASVQLAVIGPRWLERRSDGRRRIDDPDDWVRREIRLALEARLLIVPVLVDGVAPLVAEELPEDIRALADRQYIRLGHKEAESDIGLLIERLQRRVPGLQASPSYVPPGGPDASGHDDRPSLWLTLTGLALLLLSLWLPWIDGGRLLEADWHEWEFAMIFPRGLLAVAGLVVAGACLLSGRFEAVATGLAGVGGYVAIVDPLWVRRQFVDDYTSYHPVIGIGLWLAVLAGLVLLAAVAAGLWRRPAAEPRHPNRSAAGAAGAVIVLLGQVLQIQSHHHWFTAYGSVAVLLVVAALLIPPRIPEFTRTAALAGFTALALASVVAAGNYVWLHRADDASLTDSMGRIVLNVVVALGVWTALSRPGRRSQVLKQRSSGR
jgi:hypothetical protein